MFLVWIGAPRSSLDNPFFSLWSRWVGITFFKKHVLLPLADNSSACPKNSRQKFLSSQERNLCPENRGNVSPLGKSSDQETVSSRKPPLATTSCTDHWFNALKTYLPHFIRMHNHWCWRAGNDDPMTHRHRDWTIKAANFVVRVFRVGRIQCKIQQRCSNRIPWPWKSGRDLMQMEKEEWRFLWIPTRSTQLRPLPADTDKVILLSCKKRNCCRIKMFKDLNIFSFSPQSSKEQKIQAVSLTVGQKVCPVKHCRNRQIPLLIPKKPPPPVQNMAPSWEPQQCCPSSSGKRWRSHSQNQAGQVIAMKRTCSRNCCRNEIIPRGPSTVPQPA